MLFDLFASFDFSGNKVSAANPFKETDPYKKMIFAHQESISDDACLISLHKRHDNNFPVHDDEHYQVRIFGYCFARTDNPYLKDRSRLSANRIAQIFDEHKAAFVEMIKGSFSILIFDKKENEVLVFTDPLNVRPLYYTLNSSQLTLSTSLAVVVQQMEDSGRKASVNYPALIEHKLFGCILNDDTFLSDVAITPPGACLKFNQDGLSVTTYYDPFEAFGSPQVEHSNEQVAVDKLEAILKKNLDLHLFDADRTSFALTGGLSSTTNLALLENKAKEFLFYTYGSRESSDIAIETKVTTAFNLRSKPVVFDESFLKALQKNSELALGLGDGMSDFNHIYELFAYKEIAKSYDYIMTGFFGNELLTPPSLPDSNIGKSMMTLLDSSDPENSLEGLLNGVQLSGIREDVLLQNKSTVIARILENPFVVNDLDAAKKYFLFLLMVAARKNFMRAVKVEKSFIENLHPFLDIEYVELLLKTPFSWVHHWNRGGEASDTWKSDRLYALLIDRSKPRLNNILSTRGYTPKYLLKSGFSPVMKLEYYYNRNKVSKPEVYDYNRDIAEYIYKNTPSTPTSTQSTERNSNTEPGDAELSHRELALRYWFEKNGVGMQSAGFSS